LVWFGIDCAAFQEALPQQLSRGHKNERGLIRDMAVLHALNLIRRTARRL
jgi:hypothetical protein